MSCDDFVSEGGCVCVCECLGPSVRERKYGEGSCVCERGPCVSGRSVPCGLEKRNLSEVGVSALEGTRGRQRGIWDLVGLRGNVHSRTNTL